MTEEIQPKPKGFQIGNEAWKARTKHGRDKLFTTPEILWEACVEYFEWVSKNPLWETKSYMYQGVPIQDQIDKPRAMTITGLCIFLDITTKTWGEYKANNDFSYIIGKVEDIIRTQKLEGAAADIFNANIIARELGLADKKEHTGENGSPIQVSTIRIVAGDGS